MQVVSGNGQTAVVGHELPAPLVVRVLDAAGQPAAGQVVNFRVTEGGGTVFAGAASTDSNGVAQERWTLGPFPGTQRLEVRAVDSRTGAPIVFATFESTAVFAMVRLVVVSGEGQSGVVGMALTNPVVVQLNDLEGRPVANQVVTFRVAAGGGAVVTASSATGADGRASARWQLGTRVSPQQLEASSADPVGGGVVAPVTVSATTLADAPASIQAAITNDPYTTPNCHAASGRSVTCEVCPCWPGPAAVAATVSDRYGNPVGGVAVEFSASPGGGVASPAMPMTDSRGVGSTDWTFGTFVGVQTLEARVPGIPSARVTRTVTWQDTLAGHYKGPATTVTPSGTTYCDTTIEIGVLGGKSFVGGQTSNFYFPLDAEGCLAATQIDWTSVYAVVRGCFVVDPQGRPSASGTVENVYNLYGSVPCTGTWTATKQ